MTEHQDWGTVRFNTTYEKKSTHEQKRVLSETHTAMVHLEQCTEAGPKETISYTLRMQIQQARNANKLNQKQLAAKLGVTPKIITEYESGATVPNPQMLSKMSRILGVKLKK